VVVLGALNYAAQAVRDLRQNYRLYPPQDWQGILDLCIAIERSVHFSVPDNGCIFDDKLKGLSGIEVRLPFPEITVEYYVTEKETCPELVQSPKRLAYATMVRTEDLDRELRSGRFQSKVPSGVKSEHLIKVTAVTNFDNGKGWCLIPGSYCVPASEWDDYGNHPITTGFREPKDSAAGIVGFPVISFWGSAGVSMEMCHFDINLFWKTVCNDVGGEVATVLELCEALTCSNVNMTTIQRASDGLNARRIRDGKLPLYETKGLVIDVPGKGKDYAFGSSEGGDRSSPRQHLRRGHIRQLASGEKIWVSSCVVGDRGRIDKTYHVRKGYLS
jgi:hypothetical protein